MSDIRSWDLLKGVKAQDTTGAQISRVGGTTFVEGPNKAALTGWTDLHGVASSFGFGGGTTPWPDSIKLYQATPGAGATSSIKPSDIFSTEPDAANFLCVLTSATVQGNTDTAQVTLSLYDGSETVSLAARTAGTTSAQTPFAIPERVYFTEDTYLIAAESGSASAGKVNLAVGIVSRGGNPQ